MPDLSFGLSGMSGLTGRVFNALAVAVVFIVVTMAPVNGLVQRLLCKGGASVRIPFVGLAIGAGTISLLLKSLAAGAVAQALVAD
jgi:hypothetical protein